MRWKQDQGGVESVLGVQIESGDDNFTTPVAITLKWDDDDNDGLVEINGEETTIDEAELFIVKDDEIITSICVSDDCDCLVPPDLCEECMCSLNTNYFDIDVTSFSEFTLAIPLDSDEDGVVDNFDGVEDNCPNTPNLGQEDTRPDIPNNCGDACECEADLSGDGQVNGADTILYKADYNRTYYLNEPCALCIGGSSEGEKCMSDAECPGGDCGMHPTDPCLGDLNCDMQVTGADTVFYKQDYNRTPYLNEPCPPCSRDNYPCTYPE